MWPDVRAPGDWSTGHVQSTGADTRFTAFLQSSSFHLTDARLGKSGDLESVMAAPEASSPSQTQWPRVAGASTGRWELGRRGMPVAREHESGDLTIKC